MDVSLGVFIVLQAAQRPRHFISIAYFLVISRPPLSFTLKQGVASTFRVCHSVVLEHTYICIARISGAYTGRCPKEPKEAFPWKKVQVCNHRYRFFLTEKNLQSEQKFLHLTKVHFIIVNFARQCKMPVVTNLYLWLQTCTFFFKAEIYDEKSLRDGR